MSFAQKKPYGSSLVGGLSSSTAPISNSYLGCPRRDGDSLYVEDSRRIQECIQNIQSSTSFINKLRDSGNAEGWANGRHQRDIHAQMTNAKKSAVEAQSLLSGFGVISGGTPAEKSQRRLMHQKLMNNYQTALKSLEEAAQKHIGSDTYRSRDLDLMQDGSAGTGPYSSHLAPPYAYAGNGTSSNIWSTGSYMEDQTVYESRGEEYDGRYKRTPNTTATVTPIANSAYSSYDQDHQQRRYLMPIEINSGELEEEMLRERQNGIRQIESDIQGIHDLYQELSLQVGTQGNDLDNIESQMRQAANQTSNATNEVAIAQTYQRSRTKRMCVLLCAATLGLVVVLVLLARILHW